MFRVLLDVIYKCIRPDRQQEVIYSFFFFFFFLTYSKLNHVLLHFTFVPHKEHIFTALVSK